MTTERFQSFKATTWIEGQIRHRRKCYKALFFIDIQLNDLSAEIEKENEKIQVLFRYDDGSMTDIQHQDCFRVTKPGRVIRLHVGPPTDPNETKDKPFQVWQCIEIPEIIQEYIEKHPFMPDPPLIHKTHNTIKRPNGEEHLKKDMICKYWVSQRSCLKKEACPFQHPTGPAFKKAKESWMNERLKHRKIVTNDPNDPHQDKSPHALRAMIFSQWIYNTLLPNILSSTSTTTATTSVDYSKLLILDIAGGKGEISLFLSHGFGIKTVVVEPNVRKQPKYWLKRRRDLMYKHGFFNKDNNNNNNNNYNNETKDDINNINKKSTTITAKENDEGKNEPVITAIKEEDEDKEEEEEEEERGEEKRSEKSWPYPHITPEFIPTLLDDKFIEQHKELLDEVTLIIGMHADEATEPICDIALKLGKPFAVVPCCVFGHENRHRKLSSGEPVSTTKDLIQYLCEKNTSPFGGEIKRDYLAFEGKNELVYWIPSKFPSTYHSFK